MSLLDYLIPPFDRGTTRIRSGTPKWEHARLWLRWYWGRLMAWLIGNMVAPAAVDYQFPVYRMGDICCLLRD